MARKIEETVRCDVPGCRRSVARSADHISLSLVQHVAKNDVPETVGVPPAASGEFDFCSWDHALSFLADCAKEAVAHREELVANAHEAARLQAEQEAEAEREAQEAAQAEEEPEAAEGG